MRLWSWRERSLARVGAVNAAVYLPASPRPCVMTEPPRPTIVTRLQLAGMHSVHSVRAAFTALSVVEGIARADVQLGRAVIEHDGRATVARLREALQLAGCEVTAATEERRRLPVL